VDARAFQALDDAVHAALSHELDELARLSGLIDDLCARVGTLEVLCRRFEAVERKLDPRPSADQEYEVVRLHLSGVSTRGIAQLLGISQDTVVRRVQKLPRPARTTGLDGRRRRQPQPHALSDSVS
jgi:DNA-binding NarL/FixJ family response regulator